MAAMSVIESETLGRLQAAILAELDAHPAGLSEFELLQALRQREGLGFAPERLDDSETLFRTHFLLFHLLYRISDALAEGGGGGLEIGVLRIARRPPGGGEGLPGVHDPLRDYYLDLSNLDTRREEIDRMLDDFWRGFVRHDRRGEALQVLGLDADADEETIRRRYRRLAMEHHPDRGGDKDRLQAINAAMAVLSGKGCQ